MRGNLLHVCYVTPTSVLGTKEQVDSLVASASSQKWNILLCSENSFVIDGKFMKAELLRFICQIDSAVNNICRSGRKTVQDHNPWFKNFSWLAISLKMLKSFLIKKSALGLKVTVTYAPSVRFAYFAVWIIWNYTSLMTLLNFFSYIVLIHVRFSRFCQS